jgi:hypothetical protein
LDEKEPVRGIAALFDNVLKAATMLSRPAAEVKKGFVFNRAPTPRIRRPGPMDGQAGYILRQRQIKLEGRVLNPPFER